MYNIVEQLKGQRFKSTTKAQYYSIWKAFNHFYLRLDKKPKRWETRLTLYVAYLIHSGKKSTTINSYISAIKAVLTEVHVKLNEDRVLLNSLVRACRLHHDQFQAKLPIKKPLVHGIIRQISKIMDKQPYLEILYKAMFITAYYGLFRIGEITESEHVLKAADVSVGTNKKKLLFILRSSKMHTKGRKPQIIKISSNKSNQVEQADEYLLPSNESIEFCPFELVKNYIAVRKLRKNDTEQFFVFRDRSPVKPHHFRNVLKQAITRIGLNSNLYESRGIRAGRSIDLLKMGLSVETIKKIGRWKSNAVYTYLLTHNSTL